MAILGLTLGRSRRGVVASAARRRVGTQTDRRLRSQAWQDRAWTYYQLVGEAHDAAQFYGKHLSKLRVFPEYLNDKGEWIEVTPDGTGDEEVPRAADLLNIWARVQGPSGGTQELFYNYGVQRFVAGESLLLVTTQTDQSGEQVETWEMLSTDELRMAPGGGEWRRVKAPGVEVNLKDMPDDAIEPLPGQAVVYRMWRRHPRFSELADSPMAAVLDVCEELVMLTRAVRARARSRVAGAGLFLYPLEVDFEGEVDQTDGEPDDGYTPFERSLYDAMTRAVEDEGDASALVPVMAGVPAELVANGFRHIDFGQAAQMYPEAQLRDEAVTRFARGVDMPVEIVLGLGNANHWTSWMIDRQTWKAHVQPVAEEMVSDFAGVYLRPAVKAADLAGVDAARVRLNYDESKVVMNPDQSRDGQQLHDRFAISDSSLRQAAGFGDEDAPSEDEIAARVERLATARGRGAAVTGIGGTEDVANENVQTDTGSGNESAPETQPDGTTAAAVRDAATLEGAISLAVTRCHQLAGSRIRTRLQRRPVGDMIAAIDGVPNRAVAMTLGEPAVRQLTLTGKQLVAGGSDCLREWMADHGFDSEWIEDTCRQVEDEALRTLWRPNVRAV